MEISEMMRTLTVPGGARFERSTASWKDSLRLLLHHSTMYHMLGEKAMTAVTGQCDGRHFSRSGAMSGNIKLSAVSRRRKSLVWSFADG
jgi:hypothetical protein